MARLLRLEYAGACYHVVNRGNYRRDVFAEDGARKAFEQTLFEAAERFGWLLHAFVIMRNHFHLGVETPEPNLGDGMRWLQVTWAARFNRFRGENGHLFQGRYKAQHVERGHALAQVAHYIHLNPARARLVAADRLDEFRWSSLHYYVRAKKQRPQCLEASVLLGESGGLADTPRGWRFYVQYLAALQAESPREREKRFGQLARGWYVGSAEFKTALKDDLKRRSASLETSRFGGLEPDDWKAAREEEWQRRLDVAARHRGIDLANLPELKSAEEKVILAAVLKQTTSVTNAWLAARLRMGEPATVSQYVRRFRLAGCHESREYQRLLSIINS